MYLYMLYILYILYIYMHSYLLYIYIYIYILYVSNALKSQKQSPGNRNLGTLVLALAFAFALTGNGRDGRPTSRLWVTSHKVDKEDFKIRQLRSLKMSFEAKIIQK